MAFYNVLDFGARGDGATNDAAAIQRAVDECTSKGGGTVILPAGKTYRAGPFDLKSNVEFHIERGAVLESSSEKSDFLIPVPGKSDRTRPWICANNAANVAICGAGLIDGRCREFVVEELPHIFRTVKWRPHMLTMKGCRNVHLENVTFKDAANWAIELLGCDDVVIHGVSVLCDLRFPNNDGIHPDRCRNVRISDCHVESGDDAIVIAEGNWGYEYSETRGIVISNCTLIATSCAIKIGSGTCGVIRDIAVSNCIIRDSNRGLGIQARDEGVVENISFSNMIIQTRHFHTDWWGCGEPIYVTAIPRVKGAKPPVVRNIRFTDISCRGENGAVIHGCPEAAVENVLFDNVRIEIDKTTRHPGGRLDVRPCPPEYTFGYAPEKGIGECTPWGQVIQSGNPGIFAYRADGLVLRNSEVVWGKNKPGFFGPALVCHEVTGLRRENFRGTAAHPERDPAIEIDSVAAAE